MVPQKFFPMMPRAIVLWEEKRWDHIVFPQIFLRAYNMLVVFHLLNLFYFFCLCLQTAKPYGNFMVEQGLLLFTVMSFHWEFGEILFLWHLFRYDLKSDSVMIPVQNYSEQ